MAEPTRKALLIGVAVALVAAIAALYVALFGSPFRVAVPIRDAYLLTDPQRIAVDLDCGSDVVVSVEETADQVIASARMKLEPGDCAAGGVANLAEPLGDRQLIDAYDGQPVDVKSP